MYSYTATAVASRTSEVTDSNLFSYFMQLYLLVARSSTVLLANLVDKWYSTLHTTGTALATTILALKFKFSLVNAYRCRCYHGVDLPVRIVQPYSYSYSST